mmetsp:Transcript_28088/g.42490  ORF Transcript_28088/g.42490 Transcript_28088/m.42490 type:complete len:325 (-) Transcript_28088:1039-2013(-)
MFMHVGANESWGSFNNLRGFPWHVHCFFTLSGFSLAVPMNPVIKKKVKYFLARVGTSYPMYFVALVFLLGNLLVSCRPSTFRPQFHWTSQPDDLYVGGDESNGYSPFFCEGTPLTPDSYWASLVLTVIFYLMSLTFTPFWVAHWWMGYYLWFVSMYNQCLLSFPWMYNMFFQWRGNVSRFLLIAFGLHGMNYIILLLTWFAVKDGNSYKYGSIETAEDLVEMEDPNDEAYLHSAAVLGWYLFSPLWVLYFVIGISLAFLYDANHFTNKTISSVWGLISDICTIIILVWSFFVVSRKFFLYLIVFSKSCSAETAIIGYSRKASGD